MAVKTCPNCGGAVAATRSTCFHCGYDFSCASNKVRCPECEMDIIKTAEGFCPNCGHDFSIDSSTPVFGGNDYAVGDAFSEPVTPLVDELINVEPLISGGVKAISCKDAYTTKLVIPDNVRVIAAKAFCGMKYLREVVIPASVEIIEDQAFADCPNLIIDIPEGIHFIGKDVIKGTLTAKMQEEERKRKEEEERKRKAGDLFREGNYLSFGTYPQTKVTDNAITAALNAAAGTLPTADNCQKWTDYGYYYGTGTTGSQAVHSYMWYIDLEYNDAKYRGVYFTSYRPSRTADSSSADHSYQDDNGYTKGNVYWFAYEPIKWRILTESSSIATILCEMAIDSQAYQDTHSGSNPFYNNSAGTPAGTYANNYKYSTIRAWLNETFYNTAFNELQKSIIEVTTVDNSARSTSDSGNNITQATEYYCSNTFDYIYLLSEQEVTTSAYGFDSSYSNSDTVRRKQSTDYAKSQGCLTSTESGYQGNCWWWLLRSPNCSNSVSARDVSSDGNAADNHNVVSGTFGAVVPALRIRL